MQVRHGTPNGKGKVRTERKKQRARKVTRALGSINEFQM